jgi:integrase/recombinase XerD
MASGALPLPRLKITSSSKTASWWTAGRAERHPEGTYYIEWYENGVRRRQSVKDSAEVLEHARRKAIELDAGKAGIEIAESEEGERIRVRDAVDTYLKEIEPPQREPKTYTAYKHCLELFAQTCRKTYIQEITREDLLGFIRKLYEVGCGPRTAYNRAVSLSAPQVDRHSGIAAQAGLAEICRSNSVDL